MLENLKEDLKRRINQLRGIEEEHVEEPIPEFKIDKNYTKCYVLLIDHKGQDLIDTFINEDGGKFDIKVSPNDSFVEETPEIRSVNDYLTTILPFCFGQLNMTAKEIYDSTPWEINMRIKGYEKRQRQKRVTTASFLTLPILNSGFNRRKKGYTLQDIIPEDLGAQTITKEELDKWRELLDNAVKCTGKVRNG